MNNIRQITLDSINTLVRASCKFDSDCTKTKVKNIEIGIYNWCIDYAIEKNIVRNWNSQRFTDLYVNKAKSIILNLQNERLMERFIGGEFEGEDLAFIEHERLVPEKWKEILDDKLKKDELIFEEKPAAMTDKFKCGKCKMRACSYQEVQLRSADEPMTLLVTCVNCGHRWRIG